MKTLIFRQIALLIAILSCITSVGAAQEDDILGSWTCSGVSDGIKFKSYSSFVSSGEYTTTSTLQLPQDVDNDGDIDLIELMTMDKGLWSITKNGYLESKVNDADLLGTTVDSEVIPMQRVEAAFGGFIQSIVGAITSLKIESLNAESFTANTSDVQVACKR